VLVQILVQLAPVLVAVAVAVLALHLVRNPRARQNVQVLPAASWTPRYGAPRYPAAAPPAPTTAAPSAAALSSASVEDLYLRWGPPESESLDTAPASTPRAALPPGRRAHAGRRPAGGDRGRRR
jgi:hypothetical protein